MKGLILSDRPTPIRISARLAIPATSGASLRTCSAAVGDVSGLLGGPRPEATRNTRLMSASRRPITAPPGFYRCRLRNPAAPAAAAACCSAVPAHPAAAPASSPV
jgi:hypothetical protein